MKLRETINDRVDIMLNRYFVFWGRIALKRWHPKIVVVTGSVGKTTMLGIIEAQLGDVARYSHNANSAIGIAFDILKLRRIYDSRKNWFYNISHAPIHAFTAKHKERIYIVEADIARPRRAELINTLLKPDITLWISLSSSHAVHFGHLVTSNKSIDQVIAGEFAKLVKNTKHEVIYDADSTLMYRYLRPIRGITRPVSKSDVIKTTINVDSSEFETRDGTYRFSEPMPPELAIQVAMIEPLMRSLDLKPNYDLTKMQMPPGRNNHFEGINDIDIIDSTYNAQLESVEAVLNLLSYIKHSHKWVVLGDMIEQGSIEREEHEELAHILGAMKLERIILVGSRMQKYTFPLLEKHDNVVWFSSPQEALKYIQGNSKGGELILFKGSQYLDWIIRKLLANPTDAKKLITHDISSRKLLAKKGLT